MLTVIVSVSGSHSSDLLMQILRSELPRDVADKLLAFFAREMRTFVGLL